MNLSRSSGKNLSAGNTIYAQEEALYLGKDNGLYAVDATTGIALEEAWMDELKGQEVRDVTGDDQGRLYLCAGDQSRITVVSADRSRMTYLDASELGVKAPFLCAEVLSDGSLVAGTSDVIVFFKEGKAEKVIGPADGLSTSQINWLMEGHDGAVLVATADHGVTVVKDREVYRQITIADGLANENVKSIVQYGTGYFYLTSNAIYYDDTNAIRKLENFPYSNNYDIHVGQHGECFVLSSVGIYIVKGEDLLADQPGYGYILLNYSNGLESTPMDASHHAERGNILYFCKSIYGFIEIRFLYTEGIRYNFFAFMESL